VCVCALCAMLLCADAALMALAAAAAAEPVDQALAQLTDLSTRSHVPLD